MSWSATTLPSSIAVGDATSVDAIAAETISNDYTSDPMISLDDITGISEGQMVTGYSQPHYVHEIIRHDEGDYRVIMSDNTESYQYGNNDLTSWS